VLPVGTRNNCFLEQVNESVKVLQRKKPINTKAKFLKMTSLFVSCNRSYC